MDSILGTCWYCDVDDNWHEEPIENFLPLHEAETLRAQRELDEAMVDLEIFMRFGGVKKMFAELGVKFLADGPDGNGNIPCRTDIPKAN